MSVAFPLSSRSRRWCLACALLLSQGGCSGEPDGDSGTLPRADDAGPQGDGITAYGMRYPLTAAIGEIWGRRTAWPTHFNVDYLLTNGPFSVTPILADGQSTSVRQPAAASAVLRAELYAPDARSFDFAEYTFAAAPTEMPESVRGRHFFTAARIGVDADRSGNVEASEMRDVIGGTITFAGPLPDISLSVELVLEDGETVRGGYAGLFEFITRQ